MQPDTRKAASAPESDLGGLAQNSSEHDSGPRGWSILYTLLVMLFIVGVVPLVFTYWILVDINRSILKTIQKERQLAIADLVSEKISSTIGDSMARLDATAAAVEGDSQLRKKADFTGMLEHRGRDLLEIGLEAEDDPVFLYLALVDPSLGGGVTASVEVDPAAVQERIGSRLELAFFEVSHSNTDGRAGDEPFVGEPFLFREAGLPVVVAARALHHQGELMGVLLALINLESVQRIVEEKSVEGNSVYLVNRSGRVFAHPEESLLQGGQDVSDLSVVGPYLTPSGRVFSAAVDFSIEDEDGGTVEMLGTSRWVTALNSLAVIQIRNEDIYHPVNVMVRRSLVWAGVWLLAAVLGGAVFARRISQPIKQLAAVSRRVAEGDFSARLETRSTGEIGQLARTFNLMAGNLETYISRLKTALDKYNQLFIGSLRMIAEAIDEKDPYTRGHAERVTRYSLAICRQLGLRDDELEKIRVAALLHDVGKIGIDDRVLKKQGLLTAEEYEQMKMHPLKGAGIMSPINELSESIPGVRHHHEHMNGEGYPDGLEGDLIPEMARIIGVADSFDAMTTDRCYQEKMTVADALERIRSFVGVRYDERIVDALETAVVRGVISVD